MYVSNCIKYKWKIINVKYRLSEKNLKLYVVCKRILKYGNEGWNQNGRKGYHIKLGNKIKQV